MHTELENVCGSADDWRANNLRTLGSLRFIKSPSVKNGQEKADPYIRPGDIAIVTEGEPIYITGAWSRLAR